MPEGQIQDEGDELLGRLVKAMTADDRLYRNDDSVICCPCGTRLTWVHDCAWTCDTCGRDWHDDQFPDEEEEDE